MTSRPGLHIRGAMWTTIVTVCLAGIGLGCASNAHLGNMWRDSEFVGPPLENVLIVALTRDNVERRLIEDVFVASFADQGGTATASYRAFPDAPPQTEEVKEAASRDGFDGVLVLTRAGRSKDVVYVPGYTERKEVVGRSRWGVYRKHFEVIHHEGYTETHVLVRMKGDLLSADGDLIWTATSEVVDPSSRDRFRDSVASRFSRALLDADLVLQSP